MESDVVERTRRPSTAESLTQDLRELGLGEGAAVLVHASLSSIGWTVGGAQAVIQALSMSVGAAGTLMMPSHSAHLTDPSTWENPAVPADWWPTIRAAMPPYDPTMTPTAGMGAVPETFRHMPAVSRSAHPTASFVARGPHREDLLANHGLDDGFGEDSPLARLYDLRGWVLLLGVGHDSNTSLHLAQYRAAGLDAPRVSASSPVHSPEGGEWVTYRELPKETDDFPALGSAFENHTDSTRLGEVGLATCRLMPIVDLVDFASEWLTREENSTPDEMS